jgi:hypothetical protein
VVGQVHALGPLTHVLMLLGRHQDAMAASERAVALAETLGDRSQLDWHLAVHAEVLAAAGRLDDALGLLDAPVAGGLAIADVAYSNHVLHLWLAGRWDSALATARRLLVASPVQVPVRTAWALTVAGAIETGAGRADAARPLLALAERTYDGRHFYHFSALPRLGGGRRRVAAGRGAAGARAPRALGRLARRDGSGGAARVRPAAPLRDGGRSGRPWRRPPLAGPGP